MEKLLTSTWKFFVMVISPSDICGVFAGKHRKHPGGRGNAGGQHHHRINFDK